ncbi:ephrin_rec_like domain-containing protein [Trichonephila clavata]|uniref:Ephrin_rec_like domain-containing protein n=1 Tax=Trichonephila clavata TaxID=2740835 RepID=A0A8X6HMK5_TRICU|nr:ephrin_rec_like domain-containing protein [Trichonephila clavata]
MHSPISVLLCLMLFLHISSELRLEVSLNDYSGSRTKIKLVCEPSKSALEYAKEHKILWKGSKFGMRERNKLRERLPGSIFVPEINVNSPEHYHCFLLSPKSTDEDYNGSKKRFEREAEDFVPAQFGSCSPGYRIDQDKCYPCPPGSYTSGQDSSCSLCPKDFYIEKKAADSCFPCPDGKKTIIEGADSEDLCVYPTLADDNAVQYEDPALADDKVVQYEDPPWLTIKMCPIYEDPAWLTITLSNMKSRLADDNVVQYEDPALADDNVVQYEDPALADDNCCEKSIER